MKYMHIHVYVFICPTRNLSFWIRCIGRGENNPYGKIKKENTQHFLRFLKFYDFFIFIALWIQISPLFKKKKKEANLSRSGMKGFNISIMKRKAIINTKLIKNKDYELTVLHIWNEFTYPAYLEAVKKRGSKFIRHDIQNPGHLTQNLCTKFTLRLKDMISKQLHDLLLLKIKLFFFFKKKK